MVKLPPDVRDRAEIAAYQAYVHVAPGPQSDRWGTVVDAVAEVLAKDSILLSKANAAWLCGVIHGEPDVGPNDHNRYDRAHKLLEGDRDG